MNAVPLLDTCDAQAFGAKAVAARRVDPLPDGFALAAELVDADLAGVLFTHRNRHPQ